YNPLRPLRSSDDAFMLKTRPSKNMYGARSMACEGTKIWNSLPRELRVPQT
ncbi:hypothetical protein CAPTEDRAFT_95276, partial [Capitella teleta]